MKTLPSSGVVVMTPRRFPNVIITRALAFALALFAGMVTSVHAANMTLTQAILDDYHVNSIIDFSLSTIGYPPNSVTNTLQPGDTVFIQGHTRKFLRLINLTQGTTAHPITVTNTGGQLVLQVATSSDGDGLGLGIWGCQHVILRGTPSPGTYDYGIKIGRTKTDAVGLKITDNSSSTNLLGSLDIEVTNMEIGNTGFAGIQAKCESTMPGGYVMDNLRIHDNYIHDTAGEGMYIGWTSSGHHNLSNVEVQHNVLDNIGWDGIQVNFVTTNAKVHDNAIIGYGVVSNSAATETGEPNYWQDKGITTGSSEIKIYNNLVQSTGNLAGSPVFLYTYKTSSIYNNTLVYTGVSGDPYPEAGIFIGDGSTAPLSGTVINILNNTIITPEGAGLDARSTAATTNFYNNIVAAPGHSQPYVSRYTGTEVVNELTNLYRSTVAAVSFTNASGHDYSLASGSPAIDAGTNLSSYGVTTDTAGTARPQGTAYDIGSYERTASSPTIVILTPSAWGAATGSGWCPATGAFDAQPTWDAVNQRPTGDDPNPNFDTGTAYASRFWYVDFGADYTKVRITGMWTRYRPYSGGSYTGFAAVWWDSNNDTTNSGTTATGLNFATATGLADVSTQTWSQDANFSSSPVTPSGRYLVFSTGASPTNRANEFAFVGYRVP